MEFRRVLFRSLAQAGGDELRSHLVSPDEDRRQLVATEAGRDVARAQGAAHAGADLLEHEVAERVADGGVDALEHVEVEEDKIGRGSWRGRGGQDVMNSGGAGTLNNKKKS